MASFLFVEGNLLNTTASRVLRAQGEELSRKARSHQGMEGLPLAKSLPWVKPGNSHESDLGVL